MKIPARGKLILAALSFMLTFFAACASQPAAQNAKAPANPVPAYSADSLTLDEAIADISAYFAARLPEGSLTAIVAVEARTASLSDYVFEELWNRFEASGRFLMIDRRNLERIRGEILYQLSGEVSEESARAIGKQYGPQTIIYGQITGMGDEYRLVMYASDVEKASSSQRALTVRPDSRLASLLNPGLDEQIDHAVEIISRALAEKTTIAIGRISYADTQTVSSLSAYLKNAITAGALKRRDKFTVAGDSESSGFATRGLAVETPAADFSIQAVVTGNFSPLDNDAQVSLRLVSTGQGRVVLASAGFTIPAPELNSRKLALLPEKDTAVISKAEFETKQTAVDLYAGKNDAFSFTVTPDDLDGLYYDGEYMSFLVSSEKDCYLKITHVDVYGNTQVIYPRSGSDNNFLKARQTRRLPDNTRFRLTKPYGEEYILAAAYDRPFTVTPESAAPVTAAAITRGLVVEEKTVNARMSPIATAKFSYTILPGKSVP
jgi:hypothetical protein